MPKRIQRKRTRYLGHLEIHCPGTGKPPAAGARAASFRPRGICSMCGYEYALKTDGCLRAHGRYPVQITYTTTKEDS
ncbi:Uncharacterised protein [Mycobacteroides abscessus subsp. massiliense]|nr:Uncharacterised protein [Mycobacteroides abscessus subsp. massiliense]